MKDYYELLEVNKNASEEIIKKVFRILIKKNHPDLFEGKEKQKAEEKVQKLNEAYEVLSDKEKREKYDLELEESDLANASTIEVLVQENEYLKSVIQEKDKIIKDYIGDVKTADANETPTFYFDDFSNYGNPENEIDYDEYINREANRLYQLKDRIKKIIYMILMIIAGIIVLRVATGINIIDIIYEIFKNMF